MFSNLLRARLEGIATLSDEQCGALQAHYELLVRWNKILNLTAVRRVEEIVERHYCESIFLASRLPEGRLSIADIGSGAGFPGIPVAIMRPECSVTLIESHQRKAVFLREASRGTSNIRVAAKRAEEVEQDFEWALSRAVSGEEISGTLVRLAKNVAFLGGENPPFEAGGVTWAEPLRLRWGARRYLWLGGVIR